MTTTAPATKPSRMLLTIPEVAAELGCGRDTVYALISRGDLPSVHIGKLRRIRLTDLTTYVDSLTESTPTP